MHEREQGKRVRCTTLTPSLSRGWNTFCVNARALGNRFITLIAPPRRVAEAGVVSPPLTMLACPFHLSRGLVNNTLSSSSPLLSPKPISCVFFVRRSVEQSNFHPWKKKKEKASCFDLFPVTRKGEKIFFCPKGEPRLIEGKNKSISWKYPWAIGRERSLFWAGVSCSLTYLIIRAERFQLKTSASFTRNKL